MPVKGNAKKNKIFAILLFHKIAQNCLLSTKKIHNCLLMEFSISSLKTKIKQILENEK